MNLNQITLSVVNMHKACEFYNLLGFTQIVDTPHYARFSCPEGSTTFSLSLDSIRDNSSVIYFEHAQLDDLVGKLKSKGVKFDQEPIDQPYLWREAVLHDPSGNKIKLYWAGENRVNPPWRMGHSASMVEHVNISVSDPDKTAEQLNKIFGWQVRWSGRAKSVGYSVHVGNSGNGNSYLALYAHDKMLNKNERTGSHRQTANLNHIGITVSDIGKIEKKCLALGFISNSHADYEPGKRFYFEIEDGVEIEVISYS